MNVIQEFFSTHPAVSIAEIEREVGCPLNTVRNYLYGQRGMPVKHTYNLVVVLSRYGFEPGGWQFTPAPGEGPEAFLAHKYTFVHPAEVLEDVFQLIDFLEDASKKA